MWERRGDFLPCLISVDDALDRAAAADGRVCLLDMGDNVGGGSSADGAELAAALLARRMGPSFVCLFDPEAAQTCFDAGVGARVRLRAGGRTDDMHGPPLAVEGVVRLLADGKFRETTPRHGGIVNFDQGPTAVVDVEGGLTLMLSSLRMVPFSLQQLEGCGVDPRGFRYLVAKGVNAPIAAYRDVCETFIRVNTCGSTCADLTKLVYRRRRRPLFPFETEGW
jgi:microcystin degradation protein MlrC